MWAEEMNGQDEMMLLYWRRRAQRRRRRELAVQRRHLRDASNPFELQETVFQTRFRISKEVGRELCRALSDHLQRQRQNGLPVHIQILAAVRFFAQGSYQLGVGQEYVLALSQPAVSQCISNVTRAVIEVLGPQWVRFPTTYNERHRVQEGFRTIVPFDGVIGAIDCTHVAIVRPAEHEEVYMNHHGYHSLNVQMTCNLNLTITSVNSRYPGSVHDQFIWRYSQTKQIMENLRGRGIQCFLLGDSGYAMETYLLTPINNAQDGTPEYAYTRTHCRARNCIERCFGVLKSRWRCLLRARMLHYTPRKAANIIKACAILHNMMQHYRVPEPQDAGDLAAAEILQPQLQEAAGGERNVARRVRDDIIRRYFT